MMSRLKVHVGLIVVIVLYVSLAGLAGWRTPLSAGPDEVAHFMFARFLKQEGYLPLTPEDRKAAAYKSDKPPLFHALVALTFWGDINRPPFVKLAYGLPRRHLVQDGVVDPTGPTRFWDVVNTEDPLAGEILFWHYGRWLATLFGAASLVVIYLLALKTFAGQPRPHRYALAAVLNIAFLPTFIFISSVFSYESLLGLWLSLYLLVALYLLTGRRQEWWYGLAGLLIGLAMVTKLATALAAVTLAVLISLGGSRLAASKWRYLSRAGWSLAGVLLGAGWWFALVWLNLNKVKGLGLIGGTLNPILVGDGSGQGSSARLVALLSGQPLQNLPDVSLAQFGRWVEQLFVSFWLTPAGGPPVLVWILYGVGLLVLAGGVKSWQQNRPGRLWQIFLALFAALFVAPPWLQLMLTGETGIAALGHHVLFPALAVWAIFIVWGLSAWWPQRAGGSWVGPTLLGLGWLAWSVAQAFLYHPPTPAPVRTVPPVLPASAHPLEVDFPAMQLAGYELTGLTQDELCCDPAHPALGVQLYWAARQVINQDYQETVSLVDSHGTPQSVWLGYTADGRYPTRAWEPGDIVRSETWLPAAGLPAGIYTLTLTIGRPDSPLTAKDGRAEITLGQVKLVGGPGRPQPGAGPETALWQGGQIISGRPPVFWERSTVQVTAPPQLEVNLVGPDQASRQPDRVAGQTRVFVVDPLWPKGDYQLGVAAEPAQRPALTLTGPQRQAHLPPSPVELRANFANQLLLLGYNLPERRIQPGESLPVTLQWQALSTMPADFIMFTRLRDEKGRIWGGYDRWPRENYSTILWAAGEVVEDGFTMPLKPDTPPGIYYLDIGFYLPVGQAPVSLPLVQNGQMSDVTSVTLGPIKVGRPSNKFILTGAEPQFKLNQPFGQAPNLILLGYDLDESSTAACQTPHTSSAESLSLCQLYLTLYWKSAAPLDFDYTTFVHVLNGAGEIVAQKDRPPLKGAYPTSLWEPGEIIKDKFYLTVPPVMPAGTYSLVVGWYNPTSGVRLAVPGRSDNSVTLRTVELGG